MCTLNPAGREVMVCDVALPIVRAALAAKPACLVLIEPVPGEGTRLRLLSGDAKAFEHRVRTAIEEASQ